MFELFRETMPDFPIDRPDNDGNTGTFYSSWDPIHSDFISHSDFFQNISWNSDVLIQNFRFLLFGIWKMFLCCFSRQIQIFILYIQIFSDIFSDFMSDDGDRSTVGSDMMMTN